MKKKYVILVDHWFDCQDGRDCITGEYSGIYHDSLEDAHKELTEAVKDCADSLSDIAYLKEVKKIK